MHQRRKKAIAGFTLVEIMIVVGIIVLLAALAIPGLLRSRLNANESTAIAGLRAIATAATAYRAVNAAYPADLAAFSNMTPPYVDTVLASGTKQGYIFVFTGGTDSYNATASPEVPNITGVRGFFVDAGGVIRASSSGAADASSTPI